MKRIIQLMLAPLFSLMFSACGGLPREMRQVTVDELYLSTENGVQKLKTIPVRMVVPEECGVAEVDQKYVSTETRILESGKRVESQAVETIPVRKLFCPPGVMPEQRQAGNGYRGAPSVPYGNAMANQVCGGFGNLQGVKEVFGCQ